MDQQDLDQRILDYYGDRFDEAARLTTRSAQGPLEHQRTQELIAQHFDSGRVIDIGGGAGIHARSLMDRGHQVTLVEPVQGHVRGAARIGVDARLGDARELQFPDDSFDAALLLGPLYHLAEQADRLQALREASRVVRSGGWVFAAGLSRFVGFGQLALGTTDLRVDDEHVALLERGTPSSRLRFPAGHFHTADSLWEEATAAGLEVLDVHGVEGPGGMLLEQEPAEQTSLTPAALLLARAGSNTPGIRDLSAHLLAVCRVR